MNLSQRAQACEKDLILLRRWLHMHPEVSKQEFNTSKRIQQELDQLGISWRKCGMETGILATIRGARPGKTILLRGDMDALPVLEETGLPYASTVPGVMHACGHDCHTAALLSAGRLLNDLREELCGTVLLAFQPAEEAAEGALSMIEQGALDGVDGCFGIHVMPHIPTGKVSIAPGPRMSAADAFFIDITGKGGHGASPHECIDAVVVTSAMAMNLQTIVSREMDPAQPAVLTIGRMEAGTRSNVIAEYGKLEGTIRYYDPALAIQFRQAVERMVSATAQAFRAKAELRYLTVMPATFNDAHMAALAAAAATKSMGQDAVVETPPLSSSEDFAYFMEKVPGAFVFMGAGDPDADTLWPPHSGKFQVAESALLNSVKLYVQMAMDFNAQ